MSRSARPSAVSVATAVATTASTGIGQRRRTATGRVAAAPSAPNQAWRQLEPEAVPQAQVEDHPEGDQDGGHGVERLPLRRGQPVGERRARPCGEHSLQPYPDSNRDPGFSALALVAAPVQPGT